MVFHSCDDGVDALGSRLVVDALYKRYGDASFSLLPLNNHSGQGGAISYPLDSNCSILEHERYATFQARYFLDGIRLSLKQGLLNPSNVLFGILGINDGLNKREDILHSANISASVYLAQKYSISTASLSIETHLLNENYIGQIKKILGDVLDYLETVAHSGNVRVFSYNIVQVENCPSAIEISSTHNYEINIANTRQIHALCNS